MPQCCYATMWRQAGQCAILQVTSKISTSRRKFCVQCDVLGCHWLYLRSVFGCAFPFYANKKYKMKKKSSSAGGRVPFYSPTTVKCGNDVCNITTPCSWAGNLNCARKCRPFKCDFLLKEEFPWHHTCPSRFLELNFTFPVDIMFAVSFPLNTLVHCTGPASSCVWVFSAESW